MNSEQDGLSALRHLNANDRSPAMDAGKPQRRAPSVEVHHFDCEPQDCVEACSHYEAAE